MKLLGQVALGFVLIVPVMTAGMVFRGLGEACDQASDWLEGKVFGSNPND